MGSRSVRIIIDAWVDKGVGIDLASKGGQADLESFEDIIGWLGAIVDNGCQWEAAVRTPSPDLG